MINYYDVLGIPPDSNQQEIKRQFRRRAKEIHPDVRPGNGGAAAEMRLLLAAYKTLGDRERRQEYDRTLGALAERRGFDYREFLRARPDDPFSQARLVFHDLLTGRPDEALEVYARLELVDTFPLERYLSREDAMDGAFLLAEQLDGRGRLVEAWDLYTRLYRLEQERPYFRHFIDEVIERLRTLTCVRMAAVLPPADLIDRLAALIALDFSRRDTAVFWKKTAEAWSAAGRNDLAQHSLEKGLQCDRKLSGVKKLMERIGYPVP
jgi:tetratricopeptide (TPR) repeat protein